MNPVFSLFPEDKAKREGHGICMITLHDTTEPDLWI